MTLVQLAEQIFIERIDLFGTGIFLRGQVVAQRQYVISGTAHVGRAQPHKTLQ